jgi:hypothetical protein
MASCITHSFIPKKTQALISSTRVLQSGCVILYYTYNAQLFLQPQFILHNGLSHLLTMSLHQDRTPHREYKSDNNGCHGIQGERMHISHGTQRSNNDYTTEIEV